MFILVCISAWVVINVWLFSYDVAWNLFVWGYGYDSNRLFSVKEWRLSTPVGKVYLAISLFLLIPYHIIFLAVVLCKKIHEQISNLITTFRVEHLGVDFDRVYTYFKSTEHEDLFYKMLDGSGIQYKKFQGGVEVLARNATTVGVFYQRAINGMF